MAYCSYCGEEDHHWTSNRGRRTRVRYRSARDAISFLCSSCVQWFMREPLPLKVQAWHEHTDLGEEREARWLEQFIPEEVLRGEKIGRLHYGGQPARLAKTEEGDPGRAPSRAAIPVHQTKQ